MAQVYPTDDVSVYQDDEDDDYGNEEPEQDIESHDAPSLEETLSKKPGWKKKLDPVEEVKRTKEKELRYLMTNVQDKLKDIWHMESWEKKKAILMSFAFVMGAIGAFLVLFGFSLTVLFAANPINYGVGAVGIILLLPFLAVVYYLICPTKKQAAYRQKIQEKTEERNQDTFLNEMMLDAAKRAKPPERKIRLIALVRGSTMFARQEFPFMGTTVREMLIEVERVTKLPMIQQLVKFEGKELTKNLDQHFVHDLHMKPDSILMVFNKGSYEMRVLQEHDPKRAAKFNLSAAPESWEDNLKKHWAKGSAIDDAIKKNNNRGFFSEDPTAAVNDTSSVISNGKGAPSVSGGKSVVTLGGGSAVASIAGQQGSIAKASISSGSLASGKVSTSKKVAWNATA